MNGDAVGTLFLLGALAVLAVAVMMFLGMLSDHNDNDEEHRR